MSELRSNSTVEPRDFATLEALGRVTDWTDAELRRGIEINHKWRRSLKHELEVRQTGERQITDQEGLAASLVGRTIVAAERAPDSPHDQWVDGENSVTLWLDDGSKVEFSGWGDDASGCTTTYWSHPRPRKDAP